MAREELSAEAGNNTRHAILKFLKTEGPADAARLARHLRLTAMAVRQHLYELEDQKVVVAEERPVPLGRPAKYWKLTAKADRLFPQAYAELSLSLIDAVDRAYGESGVERYRLMPLPGWQVLAAKDAAYLTLAIPLALILSPLAGASAALVALAVGHSATVRHNKPQARWRFSSGAPLMEGLSQAALIAMAAAAVMYRFWFALVCAALWLGSLWWFGRSWERVD